MSWALYDIRIGPTPSAPVRSCSGGHQIDVVAERVDTAIDKAVERANSFHGYRQAVHSRDQVLTVAETKRPVYVAEEVKTDGNERASASVE